MCGCHWKTPDTFPCNHCLFPLQTQVLDSKMEFFANVSFFVLLFLNIVSIMNTIEDIQASNLNPSPVKNYDLI